MIADGFAPARISLRYNGVDLKEFSTLPDPEHFARNGLCLPTSRLFYFWGELFHVKGADMLIEAFAEACPDTGRLVIAGPEGESGYVAKLREPAREKRIEDRTIFTGPFTRIKKNRR